MDYDKHIDLQDDNDLDFFLEELNRLRSMLKLEHYVFERRTTMTGRGDWHLGHSDKVRFVLASKAPKAKTKAKAKTKTPKAKTPKAKTPKAKTPKAKTQAKPKSTEKTTKA
jgi:hypothetical protein